MTIPTKRLSVSLLRFSALCSPVLLFIYSIFRYFDGLDGDYGPGLAWNLGHAAFLFAFILFGMLTLAARSLILSNRPNHSIAVNAFSCITIFGVVLFIIVILTDLFSSLEQFFELPDILMMIGPITFIVGFVGILAALATLLPSAAPFWTPIVVGLALPLIGVNLDLLPLAAVLMFIALGQIRPEKALRTSAD